MTKVHIDFETFSECSLKDAGAWNYSKHHSTKMLCCAVAEDDKPPVLYTEAMEVAKIITLYIRDTDVQLFAWNSFFECCIIRNTLGVALHGFEQWNDVMAWASASALPQSLGGCAKVFFPRDADKQKDALGKSLINKLCVPQKMTWMQLQRSDKWRSQNKKDAKILDKALRLKNRAPKIQHPDEKHFAYLEYIEIVKEFENAKVSPAIKHDNYDELMTQLGEYCVQDVEVERNMSKIIRPLSDTEKQVWVEDQRINWRGIKCDTAFCINAVSLYERAKEEKMQALQKLTGLDNPNSPTQITKWLSQYIEVPNLQAATIRELLEGELPNNVREVLELRSSSARTPPKKYSAMLNKADSEDSRIRQTMAFHAASTGRWASRGINLQNSPRPAFKKFESPVELIEQGRLAPLELVHGDVIDTLCSTIRCALVPSEGNTLAVSDYSSIEARVLAWLSGSDDLLEVFKTHGKVYEHTAAGIYNKPINKINSDERFIGKTATLALGYQGGYSAFLRMAKQYGVELPEDLARTTVKKWREANPKIVGLWADAQAAAMTATKNLGKVVKVNDHVAFRFIKHAGRPYLLCRLPSGRTLSYVHPLIVDGKYGEALTYAGIDSFSRQWKRIDTYGGKLIENITQAVARDVMAAALLNIRGSAYDNVVLTVHDEIICDVPESTADVDELSKLMCSLPEWANGLPVSAEGGLTKRYWK